jgi:DUF4097 and DUF4098 domain-containing protein YvlB
MMLLTVLAALTTVPVQAGEFQTDTTFAVPAGTRLRLDNANGDVRVRAWDRPQVRVQADHSSRLEIGITVASGILRIEPRGARGFPAVGAVDYVLTVPAEMSIEVGGMNADVEIEGTRGEVKVNTVSGDITVRGGGGRLALTTINGLIRVQGSRGAIDAQTVSDNIEITDVQGDVSAQAVSGDVRLTRVDGRRVTAATVSGHVSLEGTLRADGSYALTTHSGDVILAVPEGASALIRASAATGQVRASFPLPEAVSSTRRRQTWRLGAGGASVELETFSGDVRLVRPGEIPTQTRRNRGDL